MYPTFASVYYFISHFYSMKTEIRRKEAIVDRSVIDRMLEESLAVYRPITRTISRLFYHYRSNMCSRKRKD